MATFSSGRDPAGISAQRRPQIVIVGAGFAGFHCARWLDRRHGSRFDVTVVNPVDHMVYSALLPDVVGGLIDPSSVATPLGTALPSTKIILGTVASVDTVTNACTVSRTDGHEQQLHWDRLVLNPGSVTRTMGVRGVLEHARGFKTLAEAVYLRERILRELQLAGMAKEPDARERHASFVIVGAGFSGLELVAQGHRIAAVALRQQPGLGADSMRWTVLEAGPRALGEFPARLATKALAGMHKAGIEVRLNAPVAEIEADHVQLADGGSLPAGTVMWTAGVTPAPLIGDIGLPVQQGRLIVDDHLRAGGHPDVFALGDAAAVPDLTHPGRLTAQTAQQAQRQGATVARNIAASLGHGKERSYKHHDLGFVVDLTGRNAVATPLGIPLRGTAAKLAGRAYHVKALPSGRLHVLSDWMNALVGQRRVAALQLSEGRPATIPAEADGGTAHRSADLPRGRNQADHGRDRRPKAKGSVS